MVAFFNFVPLVNCVIACRSCTIEVTSRRTRKTMLNSLLKMNQLGHKPAYRCNKSSRSFRVYASGSNGSRKTTMHELISQGPIIIPGVFDALSAKLVAQAGHSAAFVSGSSVSATLLGEPDLGLLTSPEMARKTGQICAAASDIAVIADADTGGGNVLNVQRTIRQLIASGAKGCVLEDQAWPKKMGSDNPIKQILPRQEFVAKILAAREVIQDRDFFLIARTDARGTSAKSGLQDAITRANLYIEAGADAHVVGGLRSLEEIAAVGKQTKGIRVANMVEGGITPVCSLSQLSDLGFDVALFPLSSLYAATRAMQDVYAALRKDGCSKGCWDNMVSWRAFNAVLGLEEAYEKEQYFTQVQGPASSIESRLKVKVKGLVKPAATGSYEGGGN